MYDKIMDDVKNASFWNVKDNLWSRHSGGDSQGFKGETRVLNRYSLCELMVQEDPRVNVSTAATDNPEKQEITPSLSLLRQVWLLLKLSVLQPNL